MPTLTANESLIEIIARFRYDPYGFVLYSYPWGEGELIDFPDGPDAWQTEILKDIGTQLKENRKIKNGFRPVIQVARASGNGIGKSALIAWITDWALSVCPDARVNITANTEPQLRTKTWPAVAEWTRRCITAHWFEITGTSLYAKQPAHDKTWRADCLAWSKVHPESFAGLHNARRLLVQAYDEASAIDDVIFQTGEGAWTDKDTDIICLMFGNPTRRTGYFFDAFNRNIKYWNAKQIDSRTVKITNKDQIKKWGEQYGEDSDWFRVHVKGEFPESTDLQFISTALIDKAKSTFPKRSMFEFASVILGLDPAWTGEDEWVIVMRQGVMSWVLAHGVKNDDDTRIGGALAAYEDEFGADAVFIDQGWGTGVYSYGKSINRKWQLVAGAESPDDPYYQNKRAEMWAEMKQWMKDGGSIQADDQRLCAELGYPEAFINRRGKLQLEAKEDMKRERNLPSPGRADALALTFARRVQKKTGSGNRWTPKRKEYKPLG